MMSMTMDSALLAWVGALLLLAGEIAALACLHDLKRLLIASTAAEAGYVLLGLGVGGAAGDAGAAMHLAYQAVMRGLVIVAAWWLIRRTGSPRLAALAGSGRRLPVPALLFGFGMFSVMGLSPFKGSFSKFMVLYAAIEHGQWLLAAVGTLASVIAAVYVTIAIQRVCLEPPRHPVTLRPAPLAAAPLAWILAALTVVMSLWPAPVLHWAEAVAGVTDPLAVPEFEAPWSALVLVPYLGGFALYALGRASVRARDVGAVALALATLALAALAPDLDAAQRLFALLFAGISAVVVVYSLGYMAHASNTGRYWFFLFLMTGSLLGLATAHEFGNFYVFWELMTWTSYFLVVHEQSARALKAGLVYFLMCVAGAYVMHFGILLLHAEVGSFDFAVVADGVGRIAPATGAVIVACFLAGFAVKAGLVPVHGWLPLAHPAAPSAISAPLSGILTKAGVFGLVKVFLLVFGAGALARFAEGGIDVGLAVSVLGCATLIYGEVMALRQQEAKRMLAYSTLAQVGEIAAVLGLGTALATTAALLHVTNHAVLKSLLFLAMGALILRTGRRSINHLAGLGRVMPVTAICYALASFALMGLPPFNGFVSKVLLVYAAAAAGQPAIAALILLGGLVGAVYYLRVVRLLFFHPYHGPAVAEAPASMLIAMGVLAAAALFGGLLPGFQLDLVRPVAGLAAADMPSLTIVWPAGAAVAALGAVAVWLAGRRSVAWSGRLAVAVPLAALAAVLAQGGGTDGLSFWFAVLIAGVGALNLLHATGYLAHGHAQPRFYAAFCLMIAGLLGLTTARDALAFFAFWELMSGWALYVALIHEETEEARREGFKYILFNLTGAAVMMLGFAILAAHAGGFAFAAMAQALPAMPQGTAVAALALVFAGFVMKAAMLCVRIDWQMHPAEAPTPVSGYISAVLLKSGPWAVLKLSTLFGGAALAGQMGGILYAIAVIACATILYAGAMAVIQTGIKRLLIYSTVCQLGYVLMAVALGTSLSVAGGLMHAVNHMLLKDTLFLAAGAVMAQTHATSLDELGGLGRRMPVTFAVFLFAGLSLAGVPPLNGFASKWVIYQAAFQAGHPLLALGAMLASLFTLAAVLKFAHAAFLGAPTAKALHASEAPLSMLIPMGVLTAASVAVGVMPGLLLVPIAGIEAQLGLTPIPATWTGPLPDGWHPGLLSVLLLALAVLVWRYARLGRHGQAVVKTHLHECGVGNLRPALTQVTASNLFETPERAIRRALFARRRG